MEKESSRVGHKLVVFDATSREKCINIQMFLSMFRFYSLRQGIVRVRAWKMVKGKEFGEDDKIVLYALPVRAEKHVCEDRKLADASQHRQTSKPKARITLSSYSTSARFAQRDGNTKENH